MRTKKVKASQKACSGQRPYKNFMCTKGCRPPTYGNSVCTKYSGFTVNEKNTLRDGVKIHGHKRLKVHCHAIQWFFCRFLRQKNGADPTEAAPDQTNRGAGLVKIRASRSRDSARRNGTGVRVEGLIRPSLQRRAQDWAAVRVSHHLVLPRYRAFFFLVLPLPGRHTTDRTLAQCRCECPDPPGFLFADLLSSNPVAEGVPRTEVRDRRGSTGSS